MDEYKKQFQVSIFSKDGKKVASGITNADCQMPCRELPKKIDWKKFDDFKFEFEMKQSKEEMENIQEFLINETERLLSEFYAKVNEAFEKIVRNYVTPPIKGEITKGKVRWRGLQMVWQRTGGFDAFVGIRQRDVLILPDGKKIPWSSLENIYEK